MKGKFALISVIAFVVTLFFASPAFAFDWTKVGGDPLLLGVDLNEYSQLMVNDPATKRGDKLHLALSYVARTNHTPSWVLPTAYQNAQKGKVHTGSVAWGSFLNAMSYGRTVVRVVPDCTYKGQYRPLPIFWTPASKTTIVKIKGCYYQKTVTYRVAMAKPCGNVFIYHKRVVMKKMYPVYVQKKEGCPTGPRLKDFLIKGTVTPKGGTKKSYDRLSKETGPTLVGWFLPGSDYDFSEYPTDQQKLDYEVDVGHLAGKTPSAKLILTFINKKIVPPEEKVKICVVKYLDGCLFGGIKFKIWLNGVLQPPVYSSDTGTVFLAEVPVGTHVVVKEELPNGQEAVSPALTVGYDFYADSDRTLRFDNKTLPPPPEEKVKIRAVKYLNNCLFGGIKFKIWLDGVLQSPVYSSSTGSVFLAEVPVGTHVVVKEELPNGQEAVSPALNVGYDFYAASDRTLRFDNKTVTPPPPEHSLHIEAWVETVDCSSRDGWWAAFNVNVLDHSDAGTLTYYWSWNGGQFSTLQRRVSVFLEYEKVYLVTVIAVDPEGNSVEVDLPAFNEIGPSDPPTGFSKILSLSSR